MATQRLCSIPECGKPHKSLGFCDGHYRRLKLYGDPAAGGTRKGELMEFVNETVLTHKSMECLKWPYGNKGNGVGIIYVEGVKMNVNRYICSIVHGDLLRLHFTK